MLIIAGCLAVAGLAWLTGTPWWHRRGYAIKGIAVALAVAVNAASLLLGLLGFGPFAPEPGFSLGW